MGELPTALRGLPEEHVAEAQRSWDKAVAQGERLEALKGSRYEAASPLERAAAVWDGGSAPLSPFAAGEPPVAVGPIFVCGACGATAETPGFCTGSENSLHEARSFDRVD